MIPISFRFQQTSIFFSVAVVFLLAFGLSAPADGLGVSSTTVNCTPTSITVTAASTCLATVTGNSPSGTVDFATSSQDGGTLFTSSSSCGLSSGSCSISLTGLSVGTVTVTATYRGDSINSGSSGSSTIKIGCTPGIYCGTLYVSSNGGSVDKVGFQYNSQSKSLAFGPDSILAHGLPGGSDGLVFNGATGNLWSGDSPGGSSINEIDPSTGAVVGSVSTPGITPVHLTADVAGNAWGTPDGCGGGGAVSVPFTGANSPTIHAVSGDDTSVNTLVWNSITNNEKQAFYTSGPCGGSNGAGTSGHFGVLNLSTFATTCVKSAGTCEAFPAAHGGAFDPYTGDVIIFGGNYITQIDPTTLATVSTFTYAGPCCGGYDQGTVDGFGHLYVAGNGGVFFMDYSSTKKVGDPSNFAMENQCCAGGGSDDVAPLVEPGALKNSPTITTTLSQSTGPLGSSVTDSAALKAASSTAGGTVTYEYFIGGTCGGTYTAVSAVTVTNGAVPNSAPVVFSTQGSYSWEAIYSGDLANNGASSICEPLTIQATSVTTTTSCTTTTTVTSTTVTSTTTITTSTITSTTITTTTATTITTAATTTTGPIPELPFQALPASVFIVLLIASYLIIIRRRSLKPIRPAVK